MWRFAGQVWPARLLRRTAFPENNGLLDYTLPACAVGSDVLNFALPRAAQELCRNLRPVGTAGFLATGAVVDPLNSGNVQVPQGK